MWHAIAWLNSMLFVVQLLICVWLFAIPWTVAHQASLSFTISQSLLKLVFTELVMPTTISSSVIPFFSCLQYFPIIRYIDNSNEITLAHEFEQTSEDSVGQGNLAYCIPWGHKELDMTEWLNNTSDTWSYKKNININIFLVIPEYQTRQIH